MSASQVLGLRLKGVHHHAGISSFLRMGSYPWLALIILIILIILPLAPKCWDYRHSLLCLTIVTYFSASLKQDLFLDQNVCEIIKQEPLYTAVKDGDRQLLKSTSSE